jgi:hypothetical protein
LIVNRKLSVLVLVLILTASTFFIAIHAAEGQTSNQTVNYETFAYIIVSPDPVSVGQPLIVQFRIDKTVANGTILGPFFEGFRVNITKPDGSVESKGPYTADSTGGSWFTYTPDTPGEYSFQTFFPGQTFTHLTPPRHYEASQSKVQTVTVTSESIPPYPDTPLPTGYWTRPIYGEIKGASQYADHWLMQGYDYNGRTFAGTTAFAPYTSAPNSAHVLWTKPIMFGGIVGGKYQDESFYTGLSYEQPYTPLIIQGRIIYSDARQVISPGGGTHCVDLKTGEEYWYLDDVTINFAQVYAYNSPNEHGPLSHLVSTSGSTWNFYNPFDGKFQFAIANVSSGTVTFGPSGEFLVYRLSNSDSASRLTLWNSSLALESSGAINDPVISGRGIHSYSPAAGRTYDGSGGYQWNVTVPALDWSPSIRKIGDGYILAGATDTTTYPVTYKYVAYPALIDKDANGNYPASINHLWQQDRTNIYGQHERLGQNIADGKYVMFDEATMKIHCFDLQTGSELWVSESFAESGTDFATFTRDYHIAYGKVYTVGFDGVIRAFDLNTGNLVWKWYFGSAGYETPYGTWPVYNGFTIADGKIYVTNDEHSPDSTLWRGGRLVCLDANDGTFLWDMSGWLRIPAIADGALTAVNAYDNQIYSIGKGPSKTTVEAPMSGVGVGSVVTIRGTVTDQTPISKDTPAIADEYMGQWMGYLHQQKPLPTDAIGVQVTLTATSPSGQVTEIGTATTNIAGSYGITWTPNEEGQYLIKAEFAGTNSYGNSFDMTHVSVGSSEASVITNPTPSTVPTTGEGISTETLLIIGAAVVIIAIIGAAAVLLRKRQ